MPSHRNMCLDLGAESSVRVDLEREGGVLNWSKIGINMNKERIVLDCTILVESDPCILIIQNKLAVPLPHPLSN